MNFQEFLARKRALALVEHMNTLSEADAQELFNSLDEETVEFVEMVLNESWNRHWKANERAKESVQNLQKKLDADDKSLSPMGRSERMKAERELQQLTDVQQKTGEKITKKFGQRHIRLAYSPYQTDSEGHIKNASNWWNDSHAATTHSLQPGQKTDDNQPRPLNRLNDRMAAKTGQFDRRVPRMQAAAEFVKNAPVDWELKTSEFGGPYLSNRRDPSEIIRTPRAEEEQRTNQPKDIRSNLYGHIKKENR